MKAQKYNLRIHRCF